MLEKPILSSGLNHAQLEAIKKEKGEPNWVHQLVDSDFVRGVLICQSPGSETDNHCHDHDEWWTILEGEIHWDIEGREETVVAKAGDFVFVPALTFHHIRPAGDGPSIRLAVTFPGKGHLHERPARRLEIVAT
jgi:quercetin dioxygenase-like cupin family protein